MLKFSRLAERLYAVALGLYPSEFREVFADEMRTVFAEAIAERMQRGVLSLSDLLARELWGLLV